MSVVKGSRKVQSFGSSLAITLPSFFVKAAGVEKGSEVMVVYGLDGVLIVAKVDDPSIVEKGLYAILDEFERRRLKSVSKKGG